ncbi:hypothetical protein ILT44_18285 [Microvirga sp. BT689]|uniref:hypothetical protein n=1 Tax=Microvirga arvi TaxID=2778731 RepID=UPI00194E9C9D|nr:hypothetical protein [Microvirga arvi]MBM6582154.1 hypothetical protein [Microvirga arvi]
MSQQPDPTIPFDASVVDEEALRALRAVQRNLPMGDGGASGNLVGGTEAVAAFGMVKGGPSGGIAVRPHEIASLETGAASAPEEEPLKTLDLAPPVQSSIVLDQAQFDGDALTLSATVPPTPLRSPRVATAQGSSGDRPAETDTPFVREISPAAADAPEDPQVPTPPAAENPEPEEPADVSADPPAVASRDVSGLEDAAIGLDLSAALTDRDGSEGLTLSLLGMPDGASLSHGSRQPDGSWSVPASDLAHLTLTPPKDFAGTIELTLRATAQEQSSGGSTTLETSFRVQVAAVADAPAVIVADARGSEDTPVSLAGLGGALRDGDGSEALSFVLSGVPADASLSAGVRQADGSWKLLPDQLAGLTLRPPAHFSGSYTLTLTAISSESSNGASAKTSASFTVGFDPVADAGTIAGASAGAEDSAIVIRPAFVTPDPSESWSALSLVSGVPAGASLSQGREIAPGTWEVATTELQAGRVSLRPPEHADADFSLTIKAVLTDTGNGISVSREVTGTHGVTVHAVADAPQVRAGNVTGQEDQAVALDLAAALTDTDGSETLAVSIFGVPEGFTLSAGTVQSGGEWRVPAASLHDLKLVPLPDWSGTLNLTIRAISTEASTGGSATTAKSFTVTIDPVNDAPELTLNSAEHADAGVHQADVFGATHAEDIDSAQLGGAVITLSGAQPGDRLDLEGFTLHSENGRMMIGDTGIEVIGGAYAGEAGTLTLSGHASPETYANVLQSLMLESGDQSGLAAGTRSIGVVLFDSEGAASTQQSVDVVIDEVDPVQGEEQGFAATSFDAMQSGAGSDMILLMADGESDTSHSVTGSWTEQIDADDNAATSHNVGHLDQPTEHVQIIDDLQADAARISWS